MGLMDRDYVKRKSDYEPKKQSVTIEKKGIPPIVWIAVVIGIGYFVITDIMDRREAELLKQRIEIESRKFNKQMENALKGMSESTQETFNKMNKTIEKINQNKEKRKIEIEMK